MKERHKARHGVKDKRAGGTGLGRLVTKKHRRQNSARRSELPGIDNNFLLTGSPDDSTSPNFRHHANEDQRSESHEQNDGYSGLESNEPMHAEEAYAMGERDLYADMFGLSPAALRQDLSQIPTPPRDDLGGAAPDATYLDQAENNENEIEDFINSLALLEQQTHVAFDPFRPEWPTSRHIPQTYTSLAEPSTLSMNIDPMLQGDMGGYPFSSQMTNSNGHVHGSDSDEQIPSANPSNANRPTPYGNVFLLPAEVRQRVLNLILETHPVMPSGAAITLDTPELSLESMQGSLDLFASHFNTAYPLIHLGTFNIERVDRVLLLSMILLGSTYKNKDAHQLSVCLYDALIPHVFGGLSNNASPELHRLQSLLLLDCYGMYRAGPSQRYNALLLHRVLLSVSLLPN
jgi:hypothetical protein